MKPISNYNNYQIGLKELGSKLMLFEYLPVISDGR
jgi:hypothetical protein